MKFCKYYDKIFTIILCKNNRNFICCTNKILCINYWYSSPFSVLHLDVNLCSTLKMRYRILWRQKKHHTSFLLHGRILCHTRQWWTWHITQKTTESILFSYCFLPQTVWVNMVIFTQKGEWNIHSPHYAPIIDKISWLDTKNPFGVSAKPFFFIWTKPAASYRCARLI